LYQSYAPWPETNVSLRKEIRSDSATTLAAFFIGICIGICIGNRHRKTSSRIVIANRH
jgi:hypothetical protein